MQLFCPACQAAFPGTQRCPRCGGLLLLPQEAAEATAPRQLTAPTPAQAAPAGRVIVGAVFALGMYLGLRKLVMGAILAAHFDPNTWWLSFEGLVAVCGGQVLAVVFGSVVAAAGRAGGFAFGAAVGGLCGGLFLGAELLAGAPPQDLVLYIQPVLLVFVGGLAGVSATRVWGAVPILDMPVPEWNKLSSARLGLNEVPATGRPTAWVRIVVGAMVMVTAVAVADKVRIGAQRYSAGLLRVNSVGQGQFLTWQMGVLGILVGGAVAGAGTGAGVRHGTIAGALGGVGVVGLTAAAGQPLGPVSFWLSYLALGGAAMNDPAAVAAAIGGVVLLGVVGGWFGGTLFLPLAPEYLRRRLRSGLD
ncbi:TFIIB-type zinc ribbon-containing protein [Frigoriglobus tundricola]|nr:zf-TFIIB domain-containing protein [Frigoriglobus tundricola]